MGLNKTQYMAELKYKVGDKVRIKSLDWYNENKDADGYVVTSKYKFLKSQFDFCGKIMTIRYVDDLNACYSMIEDDDLYFWTDEMIEGFVEEEQIEFTEGDHILKEENQELLLGLVSVKDKGQELIPHKDYEIKQDGDKFYLVKKKPKYPKTYIECTKIIVEYRGYDCNPNSELILSEIPLHSFCKLIVARNAYWQIAGEEMGLGKPWEPDWINPEQVKYTIYYYKGGIKKDYWHCHGHILAFPTEEMRDAFYEAFKELIEECKELL